MRWVYRRMAAQRKRNCTSWWPYFPRNGEINCGCTSTQASDWGKVAGKDGDDMVDNVVVTKNRD